MARTEGGRRSTGNAGAEVEQWWTKVLVGQTGQPHPVYGEAIQVRLRHGVLHLSGELASRPERQQLISEARRHVGRGFDDVDTKRLVVKRPDGERGILDQTLIAAFPNADLAEYALEFIREHSRVQPKQADIVKADASPVLGRIGEFAAEVRKALAAGNAVLVIRVDETDAFEARELLDEDTRSLWTVTMPPTPATPSRSG